MTKKEFVKKYEIDKSTVYYYKKRFPEILVENNLINYKKLDEIISERIKIKEKVQWLMVDKDSNELTFLFKGKNAKSMAHVFVYQLFQIKEQILVRDSNYKKYLQILKHFGVEND